MTYPLRIDSASNGLPPFPAGAFVFLQAIRRRQPRHMDAVSMLLSPSLPWLRPACDGCMACPLVLPSAVQQALPLMMRHLQQ